MPKREFEISYSYREFRQQIVEVDVDDDVEELDEDEAIEALRKAGDDFSQDEELQIEFAVLAED